MASGVLLSISTRSPNTFTFFASVVSSVIFAPFAYTMLVAFACCCIPINTGMDSCGSALTAQVPSILFLSLASGPINAIFWVFFNGKICFSFFNKTKDCPAIFLENARLSALNTSLAPRAASI